MMTTRNILNLATLFLNSNIISDFDHYEPKHEEPYKFFYFYNDTDFNKDPELVDFDVKFWDAVAFPKCCPPGFLFEPENRDCVKAKSVFSQIYQDMNISVNLVKYGLPKCAVVIDRFINKNSLKRSDGNIRLKMIDGETFKKYQFCIDKITNSSDNYVIRLCHERDYCFNGTKNNTRDWCIPKCCPDTFMVVDVECKQMPSMGLHVKENKNFYESVDGYGFVYRTELTCDKARLEDIRAIRFTVKSNGSLFQTDDPTEYKLDDYCLDTRYNKNDQTYTNLILICNISRAMHITLDMVRGVLILTCICLVVTIAVYVFVYKMRNLRFFFIMMARLTWLNVLSYEIWHTIGRTRANVGQTPDVMRKKLIYYSIYATGIPVLCTLFFILGNEGVYSLPKAIRPYINPHRCSIDTTKFGNYGHYLHIHLPTSIFIIINLVLYIKTVINILKIKNDLKKISRTNTDQKKKEIKINKKDGYIVLKLGLIMGVTWIYYIYYYVTSFQDSKFLKVVGGILHFLNVLEGVYFLIIFVFKWKAVKEILHKLNIRKKHQPTSSTSTTSSLSVTLSTESVNAMPMETLSQ